MEFAKLMLATQAILLHITICTCEITFTVQIPVEGLLEDFCPFFLAFFALD